MGNKDLDYLHEINREQNENNQLYEKYTYIHVFCSIINKFHFTKQNIKQN